jgi:hypothetical protein
MVGQFVQIPAACNSVEQIVHPTDDCAPFISGRKFIRQSSNCEDKQTLKTCVWTMSVSFITVWLYQRPLFEPSSKSRPNPSPCIMPKTATPLLAQLFVLELRGRNRKGSLHVGSSHIHPTPAFFPLVFHGWSVLSSKFGTKILHTYAETTTQARILLSV